LVVRVYVVAALEAVDEGVQLRKVTDIGGGDPCVQALTVPASEDLGGFGDMAASASRCGQCSFTC